MARITYQTDDWDSVGEDYIELYWGNQKVFITIDDDRIKILADGEIFSDHPTLNVVTITHVRPGVPSEEITKP